MKSLHLTQPHAIMMVGIPGSGKSFFAGQFSDMFNAPYIDSLAIEARSRDGAAAGELIAMVLAEIAKTGQTFIFEGNSDSRVRRTEFSRWARERGYQPMLVWVQADQATSLSRSLKAKTLDREQFKAAIRGFSAPHPDEKPVVISGKHTYASQAKVVLGHLSKENRPVEAKAPERTRPSGGRSITIR